MKTEDAEPETQQAPPPLIKLMKPQPASRDREPNVSCWGSGYETDPETNNSTLRINETRCGLNANDAVNLRWQSFTFQSREREILLIISNPGVPTCNRDESWKDTLISLKDLISHAHLQHDRIIFLPRRGRSWTPPISYWNAVKIWMGLVQINNFPSSAHTVTWKCSSWNLSCDTILLHIFITPK